MSDPFNSREIDQLVASGGKLLRAISIKPEIMQLMMGVGYSEAEHKQGWELYLRMLGYLGAGTVAPAVPSVSTAQAQALADIDHYDDPAFKRATAALRRLHADQLEYMFGDGLSAKSGPESVGTVQTFLDRYAALRDGTDPNRADKREADQAAAKTLEERNIINPAIEKQLRAQIEVVKTPAPVRAAMHASAPETALQLAATAFADWLHDWRTTAQAGIQRRDYRIMLGISRRKVVADNDQTDTGEGPSKSSKATDPSVAA